MLKMLRGEPRLLDRGPRRVPDSLEGLTAQPWALLGEILLVKRATNNVQVRCSHDYAAYGTRKLTDHFHKRVCRMCDAGKTLAAGTGHESTAPRMHSTASLHPPHA